MGPLRTPRSMRSDERLFFYVAAGLMLVSIVYTLGWHVFPLFEVRLPLSSPVLPCPPLSSLQLLPLVRSTFFATAGCWLLVEARARNPTGIPLPFFRGRLD